ncbi:2523_t:CDS:2, partial [Funneliformis caledonium]
SLLSNSASDYSSADVSLEKLHATNLSLHYGVVKDFSLSILDIDLFLRIHDETLTSDDNHSAKWLKTSKKKKKKDKMLLHHTNNNLDSSSNNSSEDELPEHYEKEARVYKFLADI